MCTCLKRLGLQVIIMAWLGLAPIVWVMQTTFLLNALGAVAHLTGVVLVRVQARTDLELQIWELKQSEDRRKFGVNNGKGGNTNVFGGGGSGARC